MFSKEVPLSITSHQTTHFLQAVYCKSAIRPPGGGGFFNSKGGLRWRAGF